MYSRFKQLYTVISILIACDIIAALSIGLNMFLNGEKEQVRLKIGSLRSHPRVANMTAFWLAERGVLLGNRIVLVIGGTAGINFLKSSELYQS